MQALTRWALVFAAGAATMYFFDPRIGRRRRARLRDRGAAVGQDVDDYLRERSRRASERLQRAADAARAELQDPVVGDQQLHDRIRMRLLRLVEAPDTVAVHVDHGRVILIGSASDAEIAALATSVAAMRGVCDVDMRLRPPDMQAH